MLFPVITRYHWMKHHHISPHSSSHVVGSDTSAHQWAFAAAPTNSAGVGYNHWKHSRGTQIVDDYLITGSHLGFLLVQSDKGPKHPEMVIQCRSRALSTHEKNYAIVELDCLAIVWAITKCSFFLKGCLHFTVTTDHRPLLGIFSKPLADIANPRLVHMSVKVMSFNFKMVWLNGKNNVMTDALSRNPVSNPEQYEIKSYIVGTMT